MRTEMLTELLLLGARLEGEKKLQRTQVKQNRNKKSSEMLKPSSVIVFLLFTFEADALSLAFELKRAGALKK